MFSTVWYPSALTVLYHKEDSKGMDYNREDNKGNEDETDDIRYSEAMEDDREDDWERRWNG